MGDAAAVEERERCGGCNYWAEHLNDEQLRANARFLGFSRRMSIAGMSASRVGAAFTRIRSQRMLNPALSRHHPGDHIDRERSGRRGVVNARTRAPTASIAVDRPSPTGTVGGKA